MYHSVYEKLNLLAWALDKTDFLRPGHMCQCHFSYASGGWSDYHQLIHENELKWLPMNQSTIKTLIK